MDSQSSIRIIGGKWRSRKVHFLSKASLRPTPDRVRETLFNWLAPYIVGARCLDLFAGSGALGFEALSRGAESVIALEQDRDCATQLANTKQVLKAEEFEILNKNAIDWLQKPAIVMADIVFVDPPYNTGLLEQSLNLLETNNWIHAQSLIYFEQDTPLDTAQLPDNWSIWRQSKAAKVYYFLAIKER